MTENLERLREAVAGLDTTELAEFERWAFDQARSDTARPRLRRVFHALGLVATEVKAAEDDTARALLDSVNGGKGERVDDREAFLRGIEDGMHRGDAASD